MLFLVLRIGGRDGYSCSRRWIVGCGANDVRMVVRFLRESRHRFRRQRCMVLRGLTIGACIYMPKVLREAHLAISPLLRVVIS